MFSDNAFRKWQILARRKMDQTPDFAVFLTPLAQIVGRRYDTGSVRGEFPNPTARCFVEANRR